MSVIVQFDQDEDHVRAVGVLSEAEETYHGVARGTILVSNTAVRMLRAAGIRFRVIGEAVRREEEPE
jgi:hypothetical protein